MVILHRLHVGSLDELQAISDGVCMEGSRILPVRRRQRCRPVATPAGRSRGQRHGPPPGAPVELFQAPGDHADKAEQPHAQPEQRAQPDMPQPPSSPALLAAARLLMEMDHQRKRTTPWYTYNWPERLKPFNGACAKMSMYDPPYIGRGNTVVGVLSLRFIVGSSF